MRVLNLSLDSQVLVKDSAVQRRLIALAERVGNTTPALADSGTPFSKGELTVFVPAGRSAVESLSPNLTVHGFDGPKLFQFFRMWSRAVEEVKKNRYDLITVQDAYFLGFLGVQLGEKFKIPVEVQVHGFEKLAGGRKQLARFVLEKATNVRVVSERLKRELRSIFAIPHSKIYVLSVYTQIHPTSRLRQGFGGQAILPSSAKGGSAFGGKEGRKKKVPYPFTFLTVGRLVPVKNIALQIRAFAKLAEKVPHIRLRIVGDGPERGNLQRTTDNLQLKDKVIFEGEQKDVMKYYEEADAFLFTSDYEGWGRVALEAVAFRLPVIMTNVGLANEVLHNEQSCTVIPVGDEEQLYLAMKELLDKPALRVKFGEAGYQVFKSLPTQEEQIQEQVEMWHSFLPR